MHIKIEATGPLMSLLISNYLASPKRFRACSSNNAGTQSFKRTYSTTFLSNIKRGDIFMIDHERSFEKGDVVSSKQSSRPGVVISSDSTLEKTDHVVLANISSKIATIYPF